MEALPRTVGSPGSDPDAALQGAGGYEGEYEDDYRDELGPAGEGEGEGAFEDEGSGYEDEA
jgi:hypothetical protein